MQDGKPVWLKIIRVSDPELRILRKLSEKKHVSDSRDHCIPLLEVLDFADAAGYNVVVMPMLRNWFDPPLHLFVEVVAFVDQLLEVIQLVIRRHEYHLTYHRDWLSYMACISRTGRSPT